MRPPLLSAALACGACACAGAARFPAVDPLCGTWEDGAGMHERWWLEGAGLRGEGRLVDAAGELASSERLELIAGGHDGRGHVYVAQPGEAPATKFTPLDPDAARWPVEAPAVATRWTWANYEHDFPQEIHYVLLDDRLTATIAGPGPTPEQGRVMGWTLARVAACSEESAP